MQTMRKLAVAMFGVSLVAGLLWLERRTPVQSGSPGPQPDNRWWLDARFGLMVHWGPYSQMGIEASIPMHDRLVPRAQYEALAQTFNPSSFNARSLARIVKEAGARYFIITAKHHDGFAMYDTAFSDYKITNSPIRRDLCREIAEAMRAEGVIMGFYFSIPDWRHPDYYDTVWPVKRKIGRHHRPESYDRFTRFYTDQVIELLTNYAPIRILWFDGAQMPDCEPWLTSDLTDIIRQYDAACLVNNRGAINARYDFGSSEGIPQIDQTSRDPWEAALSMTDQWAYKPDAHYTSATDLICQLVETAAKGGNFLLNFGIDPAGQIDPAVTERLNDIGRWLRRNGESIYHTTGGPDTHCKGAWITRREHTLYLHLTPPAVKEPITVHLPQFRILSAQKLGSNEPIPWSQSASGDLSIELPASYPADDVTVIALASN